MKLTLEEAQQRMDQHNGNLDLHGMDIDALPEGLTVNGDLDLSNTRITTLPEGLTVGGDLILWNTSITALPEGLSVGASLALCNTPITVLPEGLIVKGGSRLEGHAHHHPAGRDGGGWKSLSEGYENYLSSEGNEGGRESLPV